jgi:hypothetical protein
MKCEQKQRQTPTPGQKDKKTVQWVDRKMFFFAWGRGCAEGRGTGKTQNNSLSEVATNSYQLPGCFFLIFSQFGNELLHILLTPTVESKSFARKLK